MLFINEQGFPTGNLTCRSRAISIAIQRQLLARLLEARWQLLSEIEAMSDIPASDLRRSDFCGDY
jgi:hypothetical protein